MIIYDRLWKTLKDRGLSKSKLNSEFGISKAQISRMTNNKVVYTSTIDRLCRILNCNVDDVMEYINDDKTI